MSSSKLFLLLEFTLHHRSYQNRVITNPFDVSLLYSLGSWGLGVRWWGWMFEWFWHHKSLMWTSEDYWYCFIYLKKDSQSTSEKWEKSLFDVKMRSDAWLRKSIAKWTPIPVPLLIITRTLWCFDLIRAHI